MPPKRGGSNPNSSVLYIGSIPFDWDESIIKSVVAGSGNVVDVRIGFDYAGKNKGFCFIEYQTPQWAQQAISLLNQIQLVYPNKQTKRLRIESSKESLKASNAYDVKQVLPLNDRNLLPNYVYLPPQMLQVVPYPPNRVDSPLPNNNMYMHTNNNMNMNMNMNTNMNMNMNQPSYSTSNYSSNNLYPQPQMSTKYTQATSNLPQPRNLPFETPDSINQTLGKIPPPQLIELIANLKNMINGPDSSRVHEIFNISPDLATAAAQALLLMGFIDGDVITESMKSAQNTPQIPPPPPQQMIQPQYSQQQQKRLPPQTSQFPPQNQYSPPPPSVANSKWPNLPISAQQKLLAMPPDQAELIAQVLNLPADQIRSLPVDKQSMVESLRAQYL